MRLITYLNVKEIPALDRLADDAGLGQARVLHLQRPQAAHHLLVGVVLAHVDVEAVHSGAWQLGRPRFLLLLRLEVAGAVTEGRILHLNGCMATNRCWRGCGYVQGDNSNCSKPPVDIKTKLLF